MRFGRLHRAQGRARTVSGRGAETRGFTVAELLVVLVIVAVLLGLAAPRLAATLDRAAVRAAVSEMTTAFAVARQSAIHARAAVAVQIDTTMSTISVQSGAEQLLRRDLRAAHSVRLSVTRDSMAYDARGLGIGAANLSVVARRGHAVETLFVSRLGRVRR